MLLIRAYTIVLSLAAVEGNRAGAPPRACISGNNFMIPQHKDTEDAAIPAQSSANSPYSVTFDNSRGWTPGSTYESRLSRILLLALPCCGSKAVATDLIC